MRKFWGTIVFVVMACTMAFALEISVKATVTDNRVALGNGLQYTITVTGVQDLPPPVLPAFDGFDVRYNGPATRVEVVNNSYSVEQSFNYILVPLKEGKYTLPSVPVNIKGLTVTTEPIPVEVLPAGTPTTTAGAASDPQQDIQNRLKLLVNVPRDTVYEGEGLPLTLRLYVNQLAVQDLSFPEMTQDGFQQFLFQLPETPGDDLLSGGQTQCFAVTGRRQARGFLGRGGPV